MVYMFFKTLTTMYSARMLKTLPMCNLLLQRSTRLCWNKKPVKNFPIQISLNYCRVSAPDTLVSTKEEPNWDSVDDASLDSLIDMVKSNIRLKHGPKYDYDFHNINGVLEYLLEYRDVEKSQLLRLFVNQPSICQYVFKSWDNTVAALHGNGIPVSKILKMLEICPQLLKTNPAKIDEAFVSLRKNQFSGKDLLKFVTEAPELLHDGAEFIDQKIKDLMSLFTKKDIQILAKNQPHAFLEDFEDTTSKVRYILHEIGLEQKDIVNSRALSHALQYICLRHQIMIRTGKFRKPHPKKKIDNPSLKVMLGSTTREFSEDICEISVEEYDVFEKMLERENAEQKMISSDSESDSGSDSERES